jgi:hypothetical protein
MATGSMPHSTTGTSDSRKPSAWRGCADGAGVVEDIAGHVA